MFIGIRSFKSDSKYLFIPWSAVLITGAALTLQSDSRGPSSTFLNCDESLASRSIRCACSKVQLSIPTNLYILSHLILLIPNSNCLVLRTSPTSHLVQSARYKLHSSHHASTFSFSEFSTFDTPLLISTYLQLYHLPNSLSQAARTPV